MTMRVLVTDGDNRAALAVVRSLGARGHWMAVGSPHSPALAQASRFCSHRLRYPDPAHDEAGFLDALAAAVRKLAIDVVLPVTDIGSLLVSASRDGCAPARVPRTVPSRPSAQRPTVTSAPSSKVQRTDRQPVPSSA